MKKNILITSLVILVAGMTACYAQQSVGIGIKAGLSIPNLSSGNSSNPITSGYDSRFGPDAALEIEFHLSKHFSLEPQLEYSSQGGKKNGIQALTVPAELTEQFPAGQVPPYVYANYKSVTKINYLMLPVLAKYRFDMRKHWRAYAAVGPFASLVLSAKNTTTGSSNIYLDRQRTQSLTSQPKSFNNDENIMSDLHSFDAGVSGHIGIEHRIGNGAIFIEGGGNYGLFDIQKDSKNGQNKTGAAVIDLGYQFSLSRQ